MIISNSTFRATLPKDLLALVHIRALIARTGPPIEIIADVKVLHISLKDDDPPGDRRLLNR